MDAPTGVPGAIYKSEGGIGPQKTSGKPSPAAFGFGTSTRDQSYKLYMPQSKGANKVRGKL